MKSYIPPSDYLSLLNKLRPFNKKRDLLTEISELDIPPQTPYNLEMLSPEERKQLKEYIQSIRTIREEVKKIMTKCRVDEGGDNTNLVMPVEDSVEEGEVKKSRISSPEQAAQLIASKYGDELRAIKNWQQLETKAIERVAQEMRNSGQVTKTAIRNILSGWGDWLPDYLAALGAELESSAAIKKGEEEEQGKQDTLAQYDPS